MVAGSREASSTWPGRCREGAGGREELHLGPYEGEEEGLEECPEGGESVCDGVAVPPALPPPGRAGSEGHHQDRQGPRALERQENITGFQFTGNKQFRMEK